MFSAAAARSLSLLGENGSRRKFLSFSRARWPSRSPHYYSYLADWTMMCALAMPNANAIDEEAYRTKKKVHKKRIYE